MWGLQRTAVRWLVAAILLVVCALPLGWLGTSNILFSKEHSVFFLGMSGEYWTALSRQFAAFLVLVSVGILVTLAVLRIRPMWLSAALGYITFALAVPTAFIAILVIFLMGASYTVIKEIAPDGRSVLVRQHTFFGPGDIDVLLQEGSHTYRSYGGANFGAPLEWVDGDDCELESDTPDLVLSCIRGSVRIVSE